MNKEKITTLKFLNTIGWVATMLCAIVIILFYQINLSKLPEILPIKHIQVKGEFKYLHRQKMVKKVESSLNGGYFTVNLNKIREVILEEPWVEDVSIRRQWPATITLVINEQSPVAYWNSNGYLNVMGEIFRPKKIDKTLKLPHLSGPVGRHDSVWKFMSSLYEVMAFLDYEILNLSLNKRRSWQMEIVHYQDTKLSEKNNNIIEVKLGRFDTEKRLHRFLTILPALSKENNKNQYTVSERRISIIDLRYPNGFAIQLLKQRIAVQKNKMIDAKIKKTKAQVNSFNHYLLNPIMVASFKVIPHLQEV